MNKFELVQSIILFFRENNVRIKDAEKYVKEELVLESLNDKKLIIEKYYEFDATVCEYENSKKVKQYQLDYADMPLNILEEIFEFVLEYSNETKESS